MGAGPAGSPAASTVIGTNNLQMCAPKLLKHHVLPPISPFIFTLPQILSLQSLRLVNVQKRLDRHRERQALFKIRMRFKIITLWSVTPLFHFSNLKTKT